jgi:hypothetical protein
MNPLTNLLLVVAAAVFLIWLIKQIPWPKDLEVLGTIGIVMVVLAAFLRIWPMLY